VNDSLKPWQRAFGAHVEAHRYLFGARPSLADFAFFGGNAAHFVNDPVCLRWSEASPGVLQHTNALLTARIATTNFLTVARGVMLARYVEARSPQLDAILEQAGIVRWYADYVDRATSVPDPRPTPRPSDNRPYPAGPGGG
jgi:glutathione S-transferase